MIELPGVSIVIPNYNYARFVGAAIETALAQNHPNTEVIVVDDGSTDDSRTVIANFGDRVQAVYQANGGHVAACNAGWPLGQHEIVVFLDADDLLMPEAASTVAAAWRPGVSKVQWTLQVVDEDGRPAGSTFPKYPRSLDPGAVRQALLATGGYPCPPTSGNAFARSFLEALAPIEGHHCMIGDHQCMDALLISAAPLYGDVITIDRSLGAYRVHGSNAYSQSKISASRFERYVDNEEQRIAFLERCCEGLSIAFDPSAAKERNVAYREARLMEAKLDGRSSLTLGWSGIGAILCSAQSPWQRSIRAVWVVMVAVLPLPLARKLIEIRYMPVRRPRGIEIVTRAFERRRRAGSLPGSHASGAEGGVSRRATRTGANPP